MVWFLGILSFSPSDNIMYESAIGHCAFLLLLFVLPYSQLLSKATIRGLYQSCYMRSVNWSSRHRTRDACKAYVLQLSCGLSLLHLLIFFQVALTRRRLLSNKLNSYFCLHCAQKVEVTRIAKVAMRCVCTGLIVFVLASQMVEATLSKKDTKKASSKSKTLEEKVGSCA